MYMYAVGSTLSGGSRDSVRGQHHVVDPQTFGLGLSREVNLIYVPVSHVTFFVEGDQDP